jgi:hypothetical protein
MRVWKYRRGRRPRFGMRTLRGARRVWSVPLNLGEEI